MNLPSHITEDDVRLISELAVPVAILEARIQAFGEVTRLARDVGALAAVVYAQDQVIALVKQKHRPAVGSQTEEP